MDAYKVFIPTAGIGSRLANLTDNLNKALISVGLKPNISHIIEKFDNKHEFVIAIGHKGDLIKQFIELAYPDRVFTFVTVDNYDSEGSGLGYTILKAKDHLQAPFIFISNDTLILDEIPTTDKITGLGNWIGYSKSKAGADYRSIEIDSNGKVINLYEKAQHKNYPTYIGICGIKDYTTFWNIMQDGANNAIAIGESYALEKMVKNINFNAINFEWYDTGNIQSLYTAINKYKKDCDPNILQKPDESIWFIDDKVIKFHIDESFISNRVKRSKILEPFVPKVISHTKNMYTYKAINGTILSKKITTENFKYLLDWLDKFWKQVDLTKEQSTEFKRTCLSFYKDKTLSRVNQYFNRFNSIDNEREIINGKKVPSINTILNQIDWDEMANGVPVNFHGDLHTENILVTTTDLRPDACQLPFVLLDWRQDFGGNIHYGDLYYDLAKLLHGLIVSHEIINDNIYSFERNMNEINYDFLRKNINVDCEYILEDYVTSKGYSFKKVRTLTALTFINIAPMHHYPYSSLLFYLGKNLLYNIQEDDNV
jgi:NDP-sugar pyrophosphorylase family protein